MRSTQLSKPQDCWRAVRYLGASPRLQVPVSEYRGGGARHPGPWPRMWDQSAERQWVPMHGCCTCGDNKLRGMPAGRFLHLHPGQGGVAGCDTPWRSVILSEDSRLPLTPHIACPPPLVWHVPTPEPAPSVTPAHRLCSMWDRGCKPRQTRMQAADQQCRGSISGRHLALGSSQLPMISTTSRFTTSANA